jgi:hypothetical protein
MLGHGAGSSDQAQASQTQFSYSGQAVLTIMAVALGAEQDLHNKAKENNLSCLSDNQGQGVVMQQRPLHDNMSMLSRKAPGLARGYQLVA